jgi:hypothetical protein
MPAKKKRKTSSKTARKVDAQEQEVAQDQRSPDRPPR